MTDSPDIGTGSAPAPAYLADEDVYTRPPRSHVQREHAFQRVAIAFIRRVVLPPMWVTAICHENELTDNARARAKARGVQPGVPDLYVCQAPGRSVWIELKWGVNRPSAAQKAVAAALGECEIPRGFAWSIFDVLEILKRCASLSSHANADNLAVEFQHRAEAAVARAEINAGKSPRGKSRPRTRKVPPSRIAAARRAGVLV